MHATVTCDFNFISTTAAADSFGTLYWISSMWSSLQIGYLMPLMEDTVVPETNTTLEDCS